MPIGGTCDANGNLTIKSIVPSRSWYGVFTAILKVSAGAPQWEIDLLGMPVGVAGGGSAVMGAVYSNPEDSFTLLVTGAAPNAVVSGGLYGFLAGEPEGLPQLGAISSGGSGGGTGALPGGQIVARGTLAAVNDAVTIPAGGSSAVAFGFGNAGPLAAGTQLQFEGTNDDVNWITTPVLQAYWQPGLVTGPLSMTSTLWVVATAGLSQVRVRLTVLGGGQAAFTVIARATPISLLPQALGSRPASQSLPVALANDQLPLSVALSPPTGAPATYWISSGNVSKAIGAGATEQLLVIYHPNTVNELIRIRKIIVTIESNSVASILTIRVRRLDGVTPPSGGTAVVALSALVSDPALNASDVLQTYPTVKGSTVVGAAATQSFSVGVSAAPTDITKLQPITVYSNDDATNRKPLTITQNAAGGWEVEITSTAASTVVASISAEATVG
jgi:hypothetical protein